MNWFGISFVVIMLVLTVVGLVLVARHERRAMIHRRKQWNTSEGSSATPQHYSPYWFSF